MNMTYKTIHLKPTLTERVRMWRIRFALSLIDLYHGHLRDGRPRKLFFKPLWDWMMADEKWSCPWDYRRLLFYGQWQRLCPGWCVAAAIELSRRQYLGYWGLQCQPSMRFELCVDTIEGSTHFAKPTTAVDIGSWLQCCLSRLTLWYCAWTRYSKPYNYSVSHKFGCVRCKKRSSADDFFTTLWCNL